MSGMGVLEALGDELTNKALKESGFRTARGYDPPEWKQARGNLIKLLAQVASGDPVARIKAMTPSLLKEVLTTSDFPLLFADTLDRMLVDAYVNWPAEWKNYVKLSTVADFRVADRYKGDLGSAFLPQVLEKGEYLPLDLDETAYNIQALKYGAQIDFSWENFIMDDLGMFNDVPKELGQLALNTEYRLVTNAYANAAAWASAFGVAAYTGTDVLSLQSLIDGIQVMMTRTDPAGAPKMFNPKYLVVPPQLSFEALRLLSPTNQWIYATQPAAAVGPYPMGTTNPIANLGIQVVVNPWLAIVGANAATAWYLFADPAGGCGLEAAHLRGHESPELYMKSPDSVRVGGGPVSPYEGTFIDDDVVFKVRMCFGVARRDWRYVYASDGTVTPPAATSFA